MTERLLQFIWQMQYYNKTALQTVSGEILQIIYPGQFNANQGPDFTEANIKIDNTIWAGNIELHVKASDWRLHKHDGDVNYNNVILHVVWENDFTVKDMHGNIMPVLTLQDKVSKILLTRYEELMYAQTQIPCGGSLHLVSELTWSAWKERLAVERLQRKAAVIQNYLHQTKNHWEEIFWWLLARNFGITVNSSTFESIARSLPQQLLAKHKNQVVQIECLLFGQAGLLACDFTEDYSLLLQKEYTFLSKKYGLKPIGKPVHFLRMRPRNFPTIRLAQLAMLIHRSSHLFSQVQHAVTLNEVKQLLAVTANDYWHYHYRFDEKTIYKEKVLGKQMISNIIINTIVPVLFCYGVVYKDDVYKNKALHWLQETYAEQHAITRLWKQLGIVHSSALDSQALTELTTQYCQRKKCLSCAVGASILKRSV